MGLMNYWSKRSQPLDIPATVLAACCTSYLVREASRRAFVKEKRAMTALSLASQLPLIVDEITEDA